MSARRAMRRNAGRALGALGALRLLAGARATTRGALVLAYHDIADGPGALEYSVSTEQLREQLTFVRSCGMSFIDLGDLVDRTARGEDVSGLVSVCFDDALLGLHSGGAEVLRDLDVTATVFVVAGALGTEPTWWPGAARVVTESELRELEEMGHHVGSHTLTHPSLTRIDDAQLDEELRRSRSVLEEIAGHTVDLLAYPSGHQDGRVRQATADAGYRAAFTFLNGRIEPGLDLFALPRLTMSLGHHRPRLAYHLARRAWSWPDHQVDVPGHGGPRAAHLTG